jgi:hypothetical protein
MSHPTDAWIRERLPEHLQGAIGENAIGHFRQDSSPLRAFFDLGVEWELESQVIAADLDELEPAHDTDPVPEEG